MLKVGDLGKTTHGLNVLKRVQDRFIDTSIGAGAKRQRLKQKNNHKEMKLMLMKQVKETPTQTMMMQKIVKVTTSNMMQQQVSNKITNKLVS